MSVFDDLELRGHQERQIQAGDMANVYAREIAQEAANGRPPTPYSIESWRKYAARQQEAHTAYYDRLAQLNEQQH